MKYFKFSHAHLGDLGNLVLIKDTGEGAGFRIVATPSLVSLYSWPMYGGHEVFEDHFKSVEDAVAYSIKEML